MTEPLQSFKWKDSDYERPGSDWVCGRMCELGQSCRLGPDSKGGCLVQSRCQPEKKGEKYHCTRAAVHGGKCKEGPTVDGVCCQADLRCRPQRSLAAKRRLLSCIATAIGVLFCLFIFGGSSPTQRLAPGKVSMAHAAIEDDCQACHASAAGGLGHWIHASFDSQGALKDSERCLRCHQDIGENALFAHSLSVERLSERTRELLENSQPTETPVSLQLASLTGPLTAKDELTCATCHREHHGRKASLTQLTDMQCQSCHARQFHSFEHGHPLLGDYPYQRRTRIYFDHNTHLKKYFVLDEFKRTMPEGLKPDSCQACHQPDASGQFMLTGSFQKTCASCHEQQIEDSEFPGIPFFALPVLNDSLGDVVGSWPHTSGVFKTAQLPHLMELLLKSDSDYQSAVQQQGGLDFRRLDESDRQKQQAFGKAGRAIKKLLYDISTQGEAALQQRLGKQGAAYLKLKPSIVPSLQLAQQLWFPGLIEEMERENLSETAAGKERPVTRTENRFVTSDKSGGWSISNTDFTIRYRPLGHADPVIKAWLDEAVQRDPQLLAQDRMWQVLSSPTASGTESASGALASGRCLMCHTVDRDRESGIAKINWKPSSLPPTGEQFTRFSHRPHLSLGGRQNCESCHTLDPAGSDLSTVLKKDFFQRDAENLFWQINENASQTCTSGFQPVNRQMCVSCHNRSTATQSCLQCHQYHAHSRDIEN